MTSINQTIGINDNMIQHAMYRKELELLRKIIANDGQPQEDDDQEKAMAERLLTGP
jgi:hypothetical protein